MKQLLVDPAFFQSLRQFDQENFLIAKGRGCPECGGPLDTANYWRKTRGVDHSEGELRYSLCCRIDGCRRRLTPPSLRFLGRRVYFSVIVILAVDFCTQLGLKGLIARQTLARWKAFWADQLSEGRPLLFKVKSVLKPGTQTTGSPAFLLSYFKFPARESWIAVLKFFTQPV